MVLEVTDGRKGESSEHLGMQKSTDKTGRGKSIIFFAENNMFLQPFLDLF